MRKKPVKIDRTPEQEFRITEYPVLSYKGRVHGFEIQKRKKFLMLRGNQFKK